MRSGGWNFTPPPQILHPHVNTFGFMKYIRSLEEGDHDIQGIESGSKGKFPPIETFVDFWMIAADIQATLSVGICIFDYSDRPHGLIERTQADCVRWLHQGGGEGALSDDYSGVSCQITWFNATPLTSQSYWKSSNIHGWIWRVWCNGGRLVDGPSQLNSISLVHAEVHVHVHVRCPFWRFLRNIHFAQWSEVWIT